MAEAGTDLDVPRPRSPELPPVPIEKMEKMTCALCPKNHHDCCVLYLARSESIAAHENCLLYSSGLVECEDRDQLNSDRNFDVNSVKREILRGRRLKCKVCGEKGATVGCDFRTCRKTYHFSCAKKDNAFLEVDGAQGTYKLLCQKHAPKPPGAAPCEDNLRMDGERGRNQSDNPQLTTESRSRQQKRSMRDNPIYHTAKTMKVSFLKKCKKAGLINDLFEGILGKLHSIHGRLMEETASESDYEEIESSLFDCRLFEDTLIEFQAAIMGRILESEERHRELQEELGTLEELRQSLCSFQGT